MKNIHKINENIYITSNEEMKEGDWCLNKDDFDESLIFKADSLLFETGLEAKKIILTTDQNLIKDGVQAINDEFLEWFVKNPSCEFVEVVNDIPYKPYPYEIIIPKEEALKQEDCIFESSSGYKGFINLKTREWVYENIFEMPKQETFEEAIKNELEFTYHSLRNYDFDLGFINGGVIGAKWQEQRMYSEEELKSILQSYADWSVNGKETYSQWFEQFKKK